MPDLNNRPGGPNLIVTAKTAHKVHFLDAGDADRGCDHRHAGVDPRAGAVGGRPHRLWLGLWRRHLRQARQSRTAASWSSICRRIRCRGVIDLGAVYAPHGIMMAEDGTLWATRASSATPCSPIDPEAGDRSGDRRRRDRALARHQRMRPARSSSRSRWIISWWSISPRRSGRRPHQSCRHAVEGIAVSPDGGTVYACAQTSGRVLRDRRGDPRAAPYRADRGRGRRADADAPRAGVARQPLPARLVQPGQSRCDLSGRRSASRSPRSRSRNRPMGFGFAPGRQATPTCAATTTPRCWEFELADRRT